MQLSNNSYFQKFINRSFYSISVGFWVKTEERFRGSAFIIAGIILLNGVKSTNSELMNRKYHHLAEISCQFQQIHHYHQL